MMTPEQRLIKRAPAATARLLVETVKQALAECSPEDRFDITRHIAGWLRNAGDFHEAAAGTGVLTVWRDDHNRVWVNNGGEYYSRLNLDEQYIRIDAMCWEKSLKDEGINLRKVWSSGPDA